MPVTLEIAPARSADVQIIADMSRRLVEVALPWTWTPARVARHLQHPDSLVVTARTTGAHAGQIAAFAIMHFGDDLAHLNLLAVDTRWQRRGLGRRLMEWLEESAVCAGTFTICLEVRARNPIALLFYRSLGFEETGRVPRYYSGREDALRFAKDLRDPLARDLAGLDELTDAAGDLPDGDRPPTDRPPVSAADWVAAHFKRSVT
jgi:ribosomal-protein-alanine N-acetyltransferase